MYKSPLEPFVIQRLERAGVYLGYPTAFRNATACIDLVTTRSKIDLHNLNVSKYMFRTALNCCSVVFKRGGLLWVVAPLNESFLHLTNKLYSLRVASSYFVLWTSNWIPGVFTNRFAFQKISWLYHYPDILFYPARSVALQSLADGSGSNLLQIGVADSNSPRTYSYSIPGNEKSPSSNILFTKTLFQLAVLRAVLFKANFFQITNNIDDEQLTTK